MFVIRKGSVAMASSSTKEPLKAEVPIKFDEDVSKAYVFLRGWEIHFMNNEDHQIAQALVTVDLENENIDGHDAKVIVTMGMRDKKSMTHGIFDDKYEGTVYFTVIGILKGRVKEWTVKYE